MVPNKSFITISKSNQHHPCYAEKEAKHVCRLFPCLHLCLCSIYDHLVLSRAAVMPCASSGWQHPWEQMCSIQHVNADQPQYAAQDQEFLQHGPYYHQCGSESVAHLVVTYGSLLNAPLLGMRRLLCAGLTSQAS